MQPIFTYRPNEPEKGYVVEYVMRPDLIQVAASTEEVAVSLVDVMTKAFFAGTMYLSAAARKHAENLYVMAYAEPEHAVVTEVKEETDDTQPLLA